MPMLMRITKISMIIAATFVEFQNEFELLNDGWNKKVVEANTILRKVICTAKILIRVIFLI